MMMLMIMVINGIINILLLMYVPTVSFIRDYPAWKRCSGTLAPWLLVFRGFGSFEVFRVFRIPKYMWGVQGGLKPPPYILGVLCRLHLGADMSNPLLHLRPVACGSRWLGSAGTENVLLFQKRSAQRGIIIIIIIINDFITIIIVIITIT